MTFKAEYDVSVYSGLYDQRTTLKGEAEIEVWYDPVFNERSSDEYGFVNYIAKELFKDHLYESGGYLFEVPFQNKNAIIGKENFTKTGSLSYPEEGNATGGITYNIERCWYC